jgi:hypothetical protein
MKKTLLIFFSLISISCAFNSTTPEYIPAWWQKEETGTICSYGTGVHDKEHIARLAAQNDAYYKFPPIITKYLNDYVAQYCIEPGDDMIQKELDRIFLNFNNYYMNIKSPAMTLGYSEAIRMKIKGKTHYKYFVQLLISESDLKAAFVEYLQTTDLYILPKLRILLKNASGSFSPSCS